MSEVKRYRFHAIGKPPLGNLAECIDGEYILAADFERVERLYGALSEKYKGLVKFYDDHVGTPCEQVRHRQEVEALQQRVAALERARLPYVIDTDMCCEQHPHVAWPHDDCPGPGMPWTTGLSVLHQQLADLQHQLAAAQSEIDRLNAEMGYHDAKDVIQQLTDQRDQFQAQAQRVRGVLKYYADPVTYRDSEYGYQMIAPIEVDKGTKAQQALDEEGQ